MAKYCVGECEKCTIPACGDYSDASTSREISDVANIEKPISKQVCKKISKDILTKSAKGEYSLMETFDENLCNIMELHNILLAHKHSLEKSGYNVTIMPAETDVEEDGKYKTIQAWEFYIEWE